MAPSNIHRRRFFSQWLPEVVVGPSSRLISRTASYLFSCLLQSPAKRITLNSGETSSALEPQPIKKKNFSSAVVADAHSLLSYKSELEKVKCLLILPIHETGFKRFHEGNSSTPLRKREIAGMEMSHFDGAAKRLDNSSPQLNYGQSPSALEPQPSKKRKLSSALVEDAHSVLSYKSELEKTNSPLNLPIDDTGYKRFHEGISSTPLRKSGIAGMEMSHFDAAAIPRAKLGSSKHSRSCSDNGGNPPIGKTQKHSFEGEIPAMSKIMKNAPFPTAALARILTEIGITDDVCRETKDDVPITDLEDTIALEKGMSNSSASTKVTGNVLVTTTDGPTSTGKSQSFCLSAPDYSSDDAEEEDDQSFSFWPQGNLPAPEIADSYGCTAPLHRLSSSVI